MLGTALVRPPSAAYVRSLRQDPAPIDVARAVAQHAAYADALRACGLRVEAMPPEPDLPDACFVEDAVVIHAGRAILARPGAVERRGEVETVARALEGRVEVVRMERGRLDGGDVLMVDDVAFVGLSDRTDADGARELGRWLDVRTVPVRGGLHLKSGATPIGGRTILRFTGDFPGFETIDTDERLGGNVLAVGGHVVVSAAAPKTAELLRRRGLAVHVVDVGEFHKGDAGLTCLSLLL